jgi:hypothetical protein
MQVCRLDIESSHRANAEELDDDSECNDPAPRCNPPKHEDLISSLALLIESLIPPGVSKHTAVSSTSGSPSGTTTRRAGPANFKCWATPVLTMVTVARQNEAARGTVSGKVQILWFIFVALYCYLTCTPVRATKIEIWSISVKYQMADYLLWCIDKAECIILPFFIHLLAT